MSKKLFLAPLLAVLAFVVAPAVAQAVPHYYVNGSKLAAGKKEAVIGWGTITLSVNPPIKPVGNQLVCHNVAGGFIQNGALEAEPGTGATEAFSTYNCTTKKQCKLEEPAETEIVLPLTAAAPHVNSLPWPSHLIEEGEVIRNETEGVQVIVECINEAKEVVEATPFISNQIGGSECEGQAPQTKTGTSALHPGFLEFNEGSKFLEVPLVFGSCEIKGKTAGEVRTLGYKAQELINTKNP